MAEFLEKFTKTFLQKSFNFQKMQKYLRLLIILIALPFLPTEGTTQSTVRVNAWHDLNGDGIRTEAALNPDLQLWTADAGGMPLANTMILPTFSGVFVEFDMVPDGDYVVLFPDNTLFPDYHFTRFNLDGGDTEATDNNLDSDASPARVFGNYRLSLIHISEPTRPY